MQKRPSLRFRRLGRFVVRVLLWPARRSSRLHRPGSWTRRVRLAVGDPRRRRLTLEIVTEPLELALGVVGLTLRTRHAVILLLVNEIHDVLSEPASEVVHLLTLERIHVAVYVTFLEQQRNLERVHREHRRVANERLRILPERHLHALLARLEVSGLRQPGGAPVASL